MNNSTLLFHAIFASVLVICFTILTALGHDGNALLGVLGGQGIGGLIQSKTPTG